MMTTTSPLDGLAVVDLSTTTAGQYCGRLLAAAGADTVLIEAPAGSPTRRAAPLGPSGRSFLFEHLNQGKGSFVLDTAEPNQVDGFARLMAAADVVLHDAGSPPFDAAKNVIVCHFADFPAGPYEEWQGTEMIHQALGGAMNATGRADREPIYGVGERAAYAAGTTGYIDVLAALEARHRDGRGASIATTRYEALAAMGQNLVSQYSFNGTSESRAKYPGYLSILQCADAWVVLFAIRNWEQLCEVFGRTDLLEDPDYATQAGRLAGWEDITAALQQAATSWLAADLVDALQRSRISASVVAPLAMLVESEQWQVRRVVREVTDPDDGHTVAALSRTFEMDDVDVGVTTPAPRLDDDRGVVERISTRARPDRTMPPETSADTAAVGPLAGVRVLEFTTAWAGPFAGRCLANLGAEVIKIETASHLDSWRGPMTGGNPAFYPEGEPGDDAIDRSVLFCSQNIDKRSFGLDLKRDGAREVFDELVRRADIVFANFKPGVLDRLTGGIDRLRSINPEVSIVEMPAFGPGGPTSDYQGMGKTMEPAAGMTGLIGYVDSPVLTGPAFMDPVGGLNGVAAVVTALARRRRTGTGSRIVVPQVEAASHWIGEFVLEQLETGTTWVPDGNAAPVGAPHDAYRSAGEDNWVAIAVTNDAQWSTLIDVLDRSELTHDRRFDTVGGRRAHADELRTVIEEWTGTRDKFAAAEQLQRRGVPAAPVMDGAEIATDDAMRAARMITDLDHPKVGRRSYGDLGFRFDRWPTRHRHAAPVFGEANDALLTELLDLAPEAVDRLRASGAIVDHPVSNQSTPPPHKETTTR